MGNTESSLAGFRDNVVELTSKITNPNEDLDWDKLLPINTAKDLYMALQPADIRTLRDTQPNAVATLCDKAVKALVHATKAIPSQNEHRKLLNCIRLMTRLVPFLFEEAEWRNYFWLTLPNNDDKEAQSLGKILLAALSDLLFCPNFTIGPLDKNTHLTCLSKLDSCEYIWQSGVGFANKTPSSAVYDANRTEILKLLLVCFSEVMYTPNSDTDRMRWMTHFTSAENRHVLPLFTSLLNTVCAYDPVGLGMPYNYLLIGDSREPLVEVSLQLLIVCLDRDSQPAGEESGYADNYFVNYLSRIHREDDFDFMLKGFARLLNNQLQTSYLPNSTKKVGFHQELLVLVWKCCEYNQKFLYYLLKTSDVLDILVPILYHLNESRTDPSKIGLSHMGVFLILLLSGERNFGVRLNKPFTSRGLIDVPIFTGTHADLLIIIFHKLITSGNHKLQSLFDCLLTIIVNVSPYLKSLSMVTANKLVHLVEAFSTPWFIFSSPTNHHLIFFLLEMFNNIIQYQFDGNSNLVYTIIRKRQVFYQLANLNSDAISISQGLKKGKRGGEKLTTSEVKEQPDVSPSTDDSNAPKVHQQTEINSSLAQTPAIGAMTTMEASEDNSNQEPKEKTTADDSATSIANVDEEEWVPTTDWVESWKSKLPLQTIMRVLQILVPQVEKICIDKGLTDESEILKFLHHGTLVGLLPVPHPILIRKYIANAATNNWFRTYLWGVVYCRNTEPPIWFDSNVILFEIQQV